MRNAHPTEELTALVDGALAPPRAAEVERHLAGCDACRAAKERLAAAAAAFRRLPAPPEPSPFFSIRLQARLAREERRPSLAARLGAWADLSALRWKVAAPVAAVLLAGGVVFSAVRLQRAEERAVAENLDLLVDYEAVASFGDVRDAEDAAVIAMLDELEPQKEARP